VVYIFNFSLIVCSFFYSILLALVLFGRYLFMRPFVFLLVPLSQEEKGGEKYIFIPVFLVII
jgi:hypothetical protein